MCGDGLALSPTSNNGGETGKAPLQIREDDSQLVRDVKDGTSFAPIVQKVAPSGVRVFVTMKTSKLRCRIRTWSSSAVFLGVTG